MGSPARSRDRASALPWYMTKDLAALGLVTFVAVTGIAVMTIMPSSAQPDEQKVALQAGPTRPAAAPSSTPRTGSAAAKAVVAPDDLRPRSPLAAPAQTGVHVATEILGTSGGTGTVTGLSDRGVAVGTVTRTGSARAVRWATTGTTTTRPVNPRSLPDGLTASSAKSAGVAPAISAEGVIAYTLATDEGSRPAVLGDASSSEVRTTDELPTGRVLDINPTGSILVGSKDEVSVWDPAKSTVTPVGATGTKINPDGSVLVAGGSPGRPAPFVWHERTLTQLTSQAGWTAKVAGGRGRSSMVGQVAESGAAARAACWHDGQLHLLPGLGGAAAIAQDENSSGVIVGTALDERGDAHAMQWTSDQTGVTGQDLGTLGGPESRATSVGEKGIVTGWSTTKDGVEHAVVWMPGGNIIDLGAGLGSKIRSRATGISANHVYGTRTSANGRTSPVVWTLTSTQAS